MGSSKNCSEEKAHKLYITLECMLEFEKEEEKEKVLALMRRFSSATRYAYKRLLEGMAEKEIEKAIQEKHKLNARYVKDAVLIAKQVLKSCIQRGQNPKKLVFGSRELFEKLKKKHLTGKRRERLRQRWEERRYYYLYSRGEKFHKGNLNLRFVNLNNQWYLRINLGDGEYVLAKVVRNAKKSNDKWIDFTWRLLEAEKSDEWFAYNVRLKVRNGKSYAQVSWEEKTVEPVITKAYGVMGIDINAYPFHLALAYVSTDGNLEKFERIDLREMEGKTKNQREHIAWHIAKQVVERALESGKAIVVEDLQKVPKGRRGDGLAKLRRKLHKWAYRSILGKIEVYARRLGVQLIKVNPAYTSIIGKLKYAPIYNIDKDVAGAYVIARRGLGFEERLPKNYRELLKDKEFLAYAIAKVDERINKLKSELKKETNEYKKNALKGRIKRLRRYLELLLSYTRDSGKSEPATQQAVNRERKPMRGRAKTLQKSWRVLSVALAVLRATTCLEWCRDHSPLKRVLVSGDWARVAGKGSPSLPGQGTTASNCSFIHFG
ncbi:IS200/IS605 family accessory protein TnpB-related protein [Thermocrinis sp.]|jgi:IS605 OrfB family transposase|uniref:IS200/IS605 family accessory protein TnpB-related protein n=1 Tax=Thermocrinis sp. TaxID=2024383 RepID=UPI0026076CC6|nr:IS200/IS605 family accessory protein TnpB-related protein [Thermocrinis sp.]